MAKIKITNPQQIINGGAKKYYFKVKGLGGPKGDKGDKGDTGATGPQGPQGNAATVSVGSTTTLPVGYDATVTNSGSIYNAVLNFGIPQGPQGPQGATGAKGDKGDKGDQGNTGPTGPAGQNATVYIGTTTTLNPGTQATVYNSGTENNAVLNFGIPRGEKGETGATGATGATGPAGQDGQNFTPTIVDSLPATGEEGKLYLTPKARTTQTAMGNPITINLGEDAGQITSVQLDGNTTQQTYTGKNLFPLNVFTSGTGNGITFQNNGDSMSINGTCTARFDKGYHIALANAPSSLIQSGKKYTLSVSAALPTGMSIWAAFYTATAYASDLVTLSGNGSNTSATSQTITIPENATRIRWVITINNGTVVALDNLKIQLTEGDTPDYDFEPYTGGTASPNPDYPQAVNTVTGTQTVEGVGKNLFDVSSIMEKKGAATTGVEDHEVTYADNLYRATFLIKTIPNAQYTLSIGNTSIVNRVYIVGMKSTTLESGHSFSWKESGATITLGSSDNYILGVLNVISGQGTISNITNAKIQVELGSAATAYAPYNKQTLPIDLGSIELCKIGTYQDYIYKDGSDWKVHKATKKMVLDGSETDWTIYGGVLYRTTVADYAVSNNIPYSPYLTGYTNVSASENVPRNTACFKNSLTSPRFYIYYPDKFASKAELTAWLQSNNTAVYYALATPTDTTITDQTLIAQLEAVANARLASGANTITNTATGSNLAGDMEIDYYGYNHRNRYDKWLWLDINNEYEQIGS